MKNLLPLAVILALCTYNMAYAQTPIINLEGYLEVYHPEDNTSTYIGRDAGRNVTNNFRNNTFLGATAGFSNTTGSENSFFGRSAGYSNTAGTSNSFFGNSAGINNTTGNFNSFFGHSAGSSNTSGLSNSFFGRDAGGNITSGSGNVIIGASAGPTSANNSANLRLYIDSDLTNFNGSDTPLIYGEFDNDLVQINGTFRLGPTNHHFNNDDGLIQSPLGAGADIFLESNDAIVLEIGNIGGGSFQVWEAETNNSILFLDESGNLTIAGAYNPSSDINKKDNIVEVDHDDILQNLLQLPISQWQFIGEDIRHVGPMAQDFYKAFGGLGQGETTIATVDADGIALAAIKALATENIELKSRLELLESELSQIKELLQNRD